MVICCPLSPFLLHDHMSLIVKNHPRIVLYLCWVMVLVKCDQDNNNCFVFQICWCCIAHRYVDMAKLVKKLRLLTWRFDTTLANFKSCIYNRGRWKCPFIDFEKMVKIHQNIKPICVLPSQMNPMFSYVL